MPNTTPHSAPPTIVREPRPGWHLVDLGELWRHRELLYFLTWRDIKVRYKQTVLGVLWALLVPFTKMVVFTVFFGKFAGLEKQLAGENYAVFVFAGLLPWQFFASSLNRSSQSVVNSANLVKKVAFPRLVIPLASVGAGLFDFAISFLILLGLMLYYGVVPTVSILMVPVLSLLTIMAALSVGTILSALTVAYRDFRHVIPFMVQIWFFLTPVIYPVKVVPEQYHWLLSLNPMKGIVEGFRSAILGRPFDWSGLGMAVGITLVVLLCGMFYFRRMEKQFADIV